MAVTPNFGMPILTVADNAKLDTLFNSMTSALDTNLKTALDIFALRRGTTSQRTASVATAGDYWSDTTTNLLYRHNGTAWLIAPGQTLASMVGPAASSGVGAGAVIGSVISTPTLAVGQKLKIFSRFSQYNPSGVTSVIDTSWRNNAANVSDTQRDGRVQSRGSAAGAGFVVSTSNVATYTTTTSAKVSAGIFLNDATSGIFGADGTYLWIESA